MAVLTLAAGAGIWALTRDHGADAEAAGGAAETAPAVERSEGKLVAAFRTCDADDVTKVISLADAGHTVVVDTRSEYGAFQPVKCLFSVLGTSTALVSEVGSTTAMMGAQEQTEGTLTYRWSYHPDNGLNMVITESAG